MPNGKVVGATGDQWSTEGNDLAWLKDIHKRLPGIDAHGIDHRESFWMTMFKHAAVHQSPIPWVLMAWGEWFDYK